MESWEVQGTPAGVDFDLRALHETAELGRRHGAADRVLAADERRHAGHAPAAGCIEPVLQLSLDRLVVEGVTDEGVLEPHVAREVCEDRRVADVAVVLPERLVDPSIELEPVVGRFRLEAEGGELGVAGVDVASEVPGHLDVVLVGEAADVRAGFLEGGIVLADIDRPIDRTVATALAGPEVERVPLDGQGHLP